MSQPPTLTVFGLELPADVQSLDGFRRWVAGLPESGPRPRACFAAGRVHVEMSPQDYELHRPVAAAIQRALDRLTEELDLGEWFSPPSWVTDEASGLSTEPDGFLITWKSFESRVRINPERTTELLGAPDLALEVVSKTSARKDLIDLMEQYAAAGVREYWVVDARTEPVTLAVRVLRRRRWKLLEPDARGWVASPTYQRSFRLTSRRNKAGWPGWRLEVAPAR